jgi:hypothetical protein
VGAIPSDDSLQRVADAQHAGAEVVSPESRRVRPQPP